jgi:catechol 2,3-dioxygenase-like lactoylglutathione lyase family enzyme
MQVRIARQTRQLATVVAFYRDRLGLPEIARFTGHDGPDSDRDRGRHRLQALEEIGRRHPGRRDVDDDPGAVEGRHGLVDRVRVRPSASSAFCICTVRLRVDAVPAGGSAVAAPAEPHPPAARRAVTATAANMRFTLIAPLWRVGRAAIR